VFFLLDSGEEIYEINGSPLSLFFALIYTGFCRFWLVFVNGVGYRIRIGVFFLSTEHVWLCFFHSRQGETAISLDENQVIISYASFYFLFFIFLFLSVGYFGLGDGLYDRRMDRPIADRDISNEDYIFDHSRHGSRDISASY